MSDFPDRETLRARIEALDATEQRVVGGLTIVLVRQAARVRDVEWVAEQLAHVAALALGLGEAPEGDDLERLRAWLLERRDKLAPLSLAVFVRAAEDLQAEPGDAPFTYERASQAVLAYFAMPPGRSSHGAGAPDARP